MSKFKWPLAVNTFNWLDRLKICGFFLNLNNFWTQGKYIKKLEKVATNFTGAKYCVVVSSGSTANQLIAQQIKDRLIANNEWPARNQVIVGAVTWQTNVSVWVREGFEPVFLDINMEDFCLDYSKLEEYLKNNNKKVAAVFPTSILGYTPFVLYFQLLEKQYSEIKFALDNCENFFGSCGFDMQPFLNKNICSLLTSSTSGFVAHHINSGSELGFIFTNDKKEYEYFLLARAHGLRRNLYPYIWELGSENVRENYTNELVDHEFDFQVLSSNYRSSDIGGFLGLLDSKKWALNKQKRIDLYEIFRLNLDKNKYYLPESRILCQDVAFCLPIIIKNKDLGQKERVIKFLDKENIEHRPFISGNMLRQKPYQKYGDYRDFMNAEYINDFASYIGLHVDLKTEQIFNLVEELNKL